MNRIIYWLPDLSFRRIFTVFLVGITVLVVQAFGYSNDLQAQAEPVTPEAYSYQVDRSDTDKIKNDNNLGEKTGNKLKEAAENIREKLNLDEPLDPGTKEVLNSTQSKVKDTVKPITGAERGYYQDTTSTK